MGFIPISFDLVSGRYLGATECALVIFLALWAYLWYFGTTKTEIRQVVLKFACLINPSSAHPTSHS